MKKKIMIMMMILLSNKGHPVRSQNTRSAGGFRSQGNVAVQNRGGTTQPQGGLRQLVLQKQPVHLRSAGRLRRSAGMPVLSPGCVEEDSLPVGQTQL